jgi:hypothetical protein
VSERLISHSETSALLTCQHRWDFQYGFQLAGSSLKSKDTPLQLREGRAWGAAVAAHHTGADLADCMTAAVESLEADADRQREFGMFIQEEYDESVLRLSALIEHYRADNPPLGIEKLEHEIVVPIPSRSGRQDSNRYKLQTYFDGILTDEAGRVWIIEFKLRKQLSALQQIVLSRQIRWYAWAYRKETGVEPAGVIVDERLNALPKPVKLNKNGSVSKVQSCTVAEYLEAGGDDEEVLEKLRTKRWSQRESILLTTAEIDEAGQQLVSAGQQIRDFDTADRYPVRNPSPLYCPGCQFRDACPNPNDDELIDALFERVPPKKDRERTLVG